MRQTDVNLRSVREQLSDVEFSLMVNGSNVRAIVRQSFEMRSSVIIFLVDARGAGNLDGTEFDDVSCSKIIDIGSCPTTIMKLEEVVAGFVVSTNEDGQIWGCFCTIIVLVEISHLSVFRRHGSHIQILVSPDGLRMLVSRVCSKSEPIPENHHR